MKLTLQYTTKAEKKLIKEAANLKDTTDAANKRWHYIGDGLYKVTYKKGNVVVKFNKDSDMAHMLKELVLYKTATKKQKKYLARVFGGNGKKMIQRLVDYETNKEYSKKEIKAVNDAIALFDDMDDVYCGHNVVIDKNGKPVIFDFCGHTLNNI